MNSIISIVTKDMEPYLNLQQMNMLVGVLSSRLGEGNNQKDYSNADYMNLFLSSKSIEGCSSRTIDYYKSIISDFITILNIELVDTTTQHIRDYLAEYQQRNQCGKVTIDNVRRVLSSFFSWLENEDLIIKSPVRRIHKIRVEKRVKETLSDENIELLRDSCHSLRDLAILDVLLSTGIRVGELVNLNISDINLETREAIVLGKGNKERKVYLDAKAKLHIKKYLDSRNDTNPALFVTLPKPHTRLRISAVEILVRKLGLSVSISRVHPHKFRRTMATRAIDKGMPIEQVQKLLGHQQIDTTMQYAMVSQTNVKISHNKFIA